MVEFKKLESANILASQVGESFNISGMVNINTNAKDKLGGINQGEVKDKANIMIASFNYNSVSSFYINFFIDSNRCNIVTAVESYISLVKEKVSALDLEEVI